MNRLLYLPYPTLGWWSVPAAILLFVLVVPLSQATGQESEPVELTLAGRALAGPVLDVAVEGDLALTASTTGLAVYNVSAPDQTELLSFLSIPGYINGVDFYKGQALVAAGKEGLLRVNLSRPEDPQIESRYLEYPAYGITVEGSMAALAAGEQGFTLVNLSGVQPTTLGNYNTSWVTEVTLVGDMAYASAGGGGLHIVDITNPGQPEELGRYNWTSWVGAAAVKGDYAFLASGWSGLTALDISMPGDPNEINTYNTEGSALDVEIDGDYAYVADNGKGLLILDISPPRYMKRVGNYNTPGEAAALALAGDYVYLADESGGLVVIDVSDPENPRPLATDPTNDNARDIVVNGNYAYLAEGYSGLQVVEVSDPHEGQPVAGLPTMGYARALALGHELLLLAEGWAGLSVYDLTLPANPVRLGGYDTDTYAFDVAYSDGHALVADGTGGLVILNLTDPANPVLTGEFESQGSLRQLVVAENLCYLTDESAGLIILDTTNLSAPTQVGGYPGITDVEGLAVENGLLLAARGDEGLTALDVSDPANPQFLGNYTNLSHVNGLILKDRGAYVAASWAGVVLLDYTDPSSPLMVAGLDLEGSSQKLAIKAGPPKGSYLYVASGTAQLQTLHLNLPVAMIDTTFPFPVILSENVTLAGRAFDPMASAPEFQWSSSIDGFLGGGPILITNQLSKGLHTINLQVINSLGAWSQPAQINLLVVAEQPSEEQPESPENQTEAGGGQPPAGGAGGGSIPDSPVEGPENPWLSLPLAPAAMAAAVVLAMTGLTYGVSASGESGRYRFWYLVAPLMARRRERRSQDPLAHETRGYIRGFLLANPGAHYRLLKKKLKLTNGTLAHHLGVMEREGLVVSRRRGQLRCFYLLEEGVGPPRNSADDELSETQQNILALATRRPGINQKDLAEALGVTPATIKYNTDSLMENGRLRKERYGLRVAYYPL